VIENSKQCAVIVKFIREKSTARTEIMMIGQGRVKTLDAKYLSADISIHSNASLVSAARNELKWLMESLSR
jgi:hypothetical protein